MRPILTTRAILLLGLAVAPQAPAQGVTSVTPSGRIQDAESRTPMAYLSVQLLTERDSAFVAGRLTTEGGTFTVTALRKGTCVLLARAIGYRPIGQRVLVGELSAFLDLGTLAMVREAQSLSGIVVSAAAYASNA